MKQVIAVTGATGFIGQSICRQLLRHGHTVRALVRNPEKRSLDSLARVEIVPGDLNDIAALRALVADSTAVIHCAGAVRGSTPAHFDRINVGGTANLLRAIATTGNKPRLLLLSSLAAREPGLSFYSASKCRAEELLRSEGGNIAWTVLRPPAVYGPGDREMLPLFRLMARGLAPATGSPTARFSMLFVEDLSAAAIAWLHGDPVTGKTYALDDGHENGYDWHEISAVVADVCDRRVRVIRPPSQLLDLVAWTNSRLARLTGHLPMLTPEKLRELRHDDWVCGDTEFQQDHDWKPRFSLRTGLQATPDWQGYRPRN